jgi:hypothetical protein
VYVAAVVADRARSYSVHPVEIDECSHPRVQLHIMTPEFRVGAYLTPQRMAVNLDGRDFLVTEDAFLATE